MRVEELSLTSFRNYSSGKVSFSPGLNYVVGKNGEGKTNLLEALFILATTKSHRQALDKDMVKIGEGRFRVSARIIALGVDRNLGLGYDVALKKKVANVSGFPVTKLQDFIGILNVVMFSPEDLALVKGTPSDRRRFLDILLCQVDKVYFRLLQQYTHVLRQRNEALKLIARGAIKLFDLKPWDQQFAALAQRITLRRFQATERLAASFLNLTDAINRGKETLSIAYSSSLLTTTAGLDVEGVARELERHQREDLKRGTSSIGPHRDDLKFLINGLPAAAYASQGQQRTAVLGLKLAELKYMQEVTGDYPVLLLDDVLSELDSSRRQMIVQVLMSDVQAVITGTDENDLSLQGVKPARVLRVERGKVVF
ncbi:MAG: DNA replication and repair protein RecF [Firmicutes bacterium]|nr:DNA replication and repair protein RecF [candidate division NPL-UPA2 bacterium]MBT9153959.1 DNA replication and repair protein RecF [candidate division NPL-UPA2 bacterium]MBT9155131.1 DNA replication and repair protein RecF [candidate division NPL-UPA2 bacterium]